MPAKHKAGTRKARGHRARRTKKSATRKDTLTGGFWPFGKKKVSVSINNMNIDSLVNKRDELTNSILEHVYKLVDRREPTTSISYAQLYTFSGCKQSLRNTCEKIKELVNARQTYIDKIRKINDTHLPIPDNNNESITSRRKYLDEHIYPVKLWNDYENYTEHMKQNFSNLPPRI
jgi:hypothetical protein